MKTSRESYTCRVEIHLDNGTRSRVFLCSDFKAAEELQVVYQEYLKTKSYKMTRTTRRRSPGANRTNYILTFEKEDPNNVKGEYRFSRNGIERVVSV